jgi:dTDP-glucose 4,6-dehydratase
MKTYLITGAAGFIGANFIKYMLAKYPEIKIVVLDLLTYAGNLGTIAEDIDGERCEFVKGNICDRALTDELFAKYQFDYVVNFAAESHGPQYRESAAFSGHEYIRYSKSARFCS